MNSCLSSYLNTSNVLVFTFNFFGEFDPVRVCEWSRLLVNVVDVQHFTHELNDRLGLVKGSGRHYKGGKKNKNKEQISITTATKDNVRPVPIKIN